MPDDDFEFPSTVPTLAKVPVQFRACYQPTGFGGFTLTPEAQAIADEGNAALAAAQQAHEAALANSDNVIKERTDTLHGMIARAAIGDVLDAQGVPGRFAPAGLALFLTTHKVEVEPADDGDGHVALIRDGFGLRSVEAAVSAWLVSDEGRAYAPARKSAGEFGRMIADLKKQR
ncbi:hypothetical protein X753_21775 [Mesorhizobium sp. LNJC399B00]|uniref:hypothetical protein n=1 Tax=unclassified Mesorhizobium TaxID=325217 RepID=UPI0003CE9A16|nr:MULTISPECIES: hypothetical protein [unclassified Mesorhizobium]ESY03906.1 hypothetical protein X753_21775 [Mesorhizobium sp. LNJC399B00]WJI68954.1 hypothetical protein NLY36_29970 [Mesorhizobium sp. C399B]